MKKKVFGDKILAEAHGIEPPNGILLHGPSGVGKSYFTRCVAGEFNMPHARLSVSPLTSERLEYSAQLVREVFEEIQERGPMVVCFDHIEAIALSRDVSSDIGRMVALRQLLLELPKMSDTDSVVIGTTADLDSLDYAVLKPGRFSRKWYIEMPEESARREIISRNMENRKTAPSSRCPQRPLPPVTFLSRFSRCSDGRPPCRLCQGSTLRAPSI